MKEFYLMRHGQTRFNVQHRLQGVCDAPLTEVGIEQAKKAGQYLAKQEPIFDHVFTSTSERASDTLEIVTGRTDYERLKGLKGQDFGDYFVQFGGESTSQVRDRMELTIRAIMESVADGSKSLLVSHGPSILQFCRRVLDPVPDIRGLKNCCILHFTYDQGQFGLVSVYNPVEEEYIYGGEE